MSKRKSSEIFPETNEQTKIQAPSLILSPLIRNSGNNNLSLQDIEANQSSIEMEIEEDSPQDSLVSFKTIPSENDLYQSMAGLDIDK